MENVSSNLVSSGDSFLKLEKPLPVEEDSDPAVKPIGQGNDVATSVPDKSQQRSKRPRKAIETCTPVPKKPILSSPNEKKNKKSDFDDMDWVCAECKEAECLIEPSADQFLICDGGCHRVFHYPCAGLTEIPTSDDDWICKDCTQQRHQCSFCHEYGKDYVDVFPCRKDNCGLFFHESCLSLNNVEFTLEERLQVSAGGASASPRSVEADPQLRESSTATTVPIFSCPAHTCWTCTQNDARELERQQEEAAKQAGNKIVKKKRGGKKKKQSIYQCKTETRLFRCLYCPWAYHATCIPPNSRFHELAILCPEHSLTHKLPDLDMSTSMQGTVEDKIDRSMLKMSGVKRARRRLGGASSNPFFPGLRGDRLQTEEKYLLEHITKAKELGNIDEIAPSSKTQDMELPFCLPSDMKAEVHSKPPNYTHLHGLRYSTDNRPKKIPPSGERCQCVGKCDENCFNRLTLIECCGDGANSNCNVGGEDCGNRAMGKRQFVKCKPKREAGKGWGLISLADRPKGSLVLEYVGEVVNEKEKEHRLISWNSDHPNDPNFYVMGLGGGWYVDAREFANMSRFINHCCDPNCQVTTVNVKGYKRNGIYTKRDIKAGEFLSYDYHFDTKQADRFICRCGAKNCRGTMQGGGGGSEAKKPLRWKEAKLRFDNDCKLLKELEKQQVASLVSNLIPAAEQPTEHVFAGPPEKHRDTAVRNRIFLWRNASLGADFTSRNSRSDTTGPGN